jgi:hypothetical protein
MVKRMQESTSGQHEFSEVMRLAGVKMSEAPNKSDVPAFLRKKKGGDDWKTSTKDLEDEKTKSPTSSAGLARKKKELGMSEKFDPTPGNKVKEELSIIMKLAGGK